MNEFKEYRRKGVALARPVTALDIWLFKQGKGVLQFEGKIISIAAVDKAAGSPKIGDMIAKNPKDENDQWLIAESYFQQNFEDW